MVNKALDKRAVARADAPLLAAPGDPAFIKSRRPAINREKSIKVLTIIKTSPIIKLANKLRKDGKVATQNYIKTGSVLFSRAGVKIALIVLVALAILVIA